MNAPAQEGLTPFVEVVIPFAHWSDEIIECLTSFRESRHGSFRIWLVPDEAPTPAWKTRTEAIGLSQELRILPTPGNPATKRNAVLRLAENETFAFIDSDAFAPPRWLERGLALLTGDTAIVAGPNLTPPDDPLPQRISGYVMESPLGFGAAYLRHTPITARDIPEMPTCNMILRRIPGLLFRESFDTAEDMMYCRDVRAAGRTIRYDPFVVVYHHRRRVLRPFARQFHAYGRDKGRLFRDGTGARFWNAAPALLTLYLVAWLLLLISPLPAILKGIASVPMLLYALLVAGESIRVAQQIASAFLTMPIFVVAHLAYGCGFLLGLAKPSPHPS